MAPSKVLQELEQSRLAVVFERWRTDILASDSEIVDNPAGGRYLQARKHWAGPTYLWCCSYHQERCTTLCISCQVMTRF